MVVQAFSLSTGEAETWSTDRSSQEKPRGAEGHHEHQSGHCYLVTSHVPKVDQCSISQLKWLLYNVASEKKQLLNVNLIGEGIKYANSNRS